MCAALSRDRGHRRKQMPDLAVHTALPGLLLCVVDLDHQQSGEHAHSAPAKGGHDGVNVGKLGG